MNRSRGSNTYLILHFNLIHVLNFKDRKNRTESKSAYRWLYVLSSELRQTPKWEFSERDESKWSFLTVWCEKIHALVRVDLPRVQNSLTPRGMRLGKKQWAAGKWLEQPLSFLGFAGFAAETSQVFHCLGIYEMGEDYSVSTTII